VFGVPREERLAEVRHLPNPPTNPSRLQADAQALTGGSCGCARGRDAAPDARLRVRPAVRLPVWFTRAPETTRDLRPRTSVRATHRTPRRPDRAGSDPRGGSVGSPRRAGTPRYASRSFEPAWMSPAAATTDRPRHRPPYPRTGTSIRGSLRPMADTKAFTKLLDAMKRAAASCATTRCVRTGGRPRVYARVAPPPSTMSTSSCVRKTAGAGARAPRTRRFRTGAAPEAGSSSLDATAR